MDWLAMGGHGFYVWSSYGVTALAIAVELAWLRSQRRDAWRRVMDMRAETGRAREERR